MMSNRGNDEPFDWDEYIQQLPPKKGKKINDRSEAEVHSDNYQADDDRHDKNHDGYDENLNNDLYEEEAEKE